MVYITFANGVSFIIMIIEMILFCLHRLKPIQYLFSSIVVAIAMGTMAIIAGVRLSRGSFQSVSMAVDVIISVVAT